MSRIVVTQEELDLIKFCMDNMPCRTCNCASSCHTFEQELCKDYNDWEAKNSSIPKRLKELESRYLDIVLARGSVKAYSEKLSKAEEKLKQSEQSFNEMFTLCESTASFEDFVTSRFSRRT